MSSGKHKESRMATRIEATVHDACRLPAGDDIPVRETDASFASYRRLIHYALPLVLSNSGIVLLQFIDRMFLAWYSPAAVAGAGAAGMIVICFVGFAQGTTSFTNVFAAQYLGSRRPRRLGPAVWQGWYLSLVFGLATLLLSFAAVPLFDWMGHGADVRAAEIDYYTAMMRGGIVFMAAAAVMGFFIGRGDNRVVMYAQLGGIGLNVLLDYAMIFGRWGFPEWGVAGAAWATVLSQAFVFLCCTALFWKRQYRDRYRTWSGWRFEAGLCLRLFRYGAPNGLRAITELVMWSVFVGLIGLLGENELAVSNVAFTINGLAWQPMIGVGMAVSMLVGKAQGADRPDLSRLAMRRGMVITQCWETLAAVLFVAFPDFFLTLFFKELPPNQLGPLLAEGRMVLWFVAVYCLFDGVNVVYAMGLVGAGDSWWVSRMTLYISVLGIGGLVLLNRLGFGLRWYWLIATLYVVSSGAAWLVRYRGKRWESMRVVEKVVVETTMHNY